MKRTIPKFTALSLSIAALFTFLIQRSQAVTSNAVPPQEKTVEQVQKNIKVLTGMPQSQLIPVMNFFAASMGRRCNFCHVNKNGQWDYASDEKPEKGTAREMIRMVLDLRKQKFTGADEISCYTCHRGLNHPISVPALPLPVPSPRPSGGAPQTGGGAPAATSPQSPRPTPSPTPSLPSADEILNKYTAAIGGQAAVDKLKSRVVKGTLTQANGTAIPFEQYQVAPNKFYTLATVGQGTVERGFNGTVGWEKTARGLREVTGEELAQLLALSSIYRHIRLKEQFKSMRVRSGELGGRPVYILIGTTSKDDSERLYFDAETGLLLRRMSFMQTMIGAIPDQIDFEDYRDVDGMKFPFTWRVSSIEVGNPISTRTFSEVKLNVAVDESKFKMPPKPANP
ncbi:MAG TPA: c-type cytochrome [Pyrinomonadaceae bacterium]